jgi:hypothetical protein
MFFLITQTPDKEPSPVFHPEGRDVAPCSQSDRKVFHFERNHYYRISPIGAVETIINAI